MAKRPPTIPDSELDVLKVLWDRGQATVREVAGDPPRRRPAVVVRHRGHPARPAGDPRAWSPATAASWRSSTGPTITHQEVRQKRVNSLVDKLYQGEPGLLVLHLLKSHPLDPGQAKEVRAVLEEMTGDQGRKKKRPNRPPR